MHIKRYIRHIFKRRKINIYSYSEFKIEQKKHDQGFEINLFGKLQHDQFKVNFNL